MATWPATLPQSLLVGFVGTRQSGMIRSNMDQGTAKQRARFTAVSKMFKAQLILTGTELAALETFFEDDLGFGATSFTWIHPITDAAATLRFTGEYEINMQLRADPTPANRLYQVTLPLEVLP